MPINVKANLTGPDDDSGSASGAATVTGGTDPSIIVSGSAVSGADPQNPSVAGGFIGGGSGMLSYQFEIVGPTTAGEIPVTLTGNDSVTQTIGTFDYQVVTSTDLSVTGGSANYDNSTGGSINTVLDLDLDTVYDVSMSASVIAEADNFATAIAGASVDPTFIAPNGYTIDYSPGLISTTPLPATWTMMLTGLGFLGFVAYRRKKKNSAALSAA